jgi:hypothetical protein
MGRSVCRHHQSPVENTIVVAQSYAQQGQRNAHTTDRGGAWNAFFGAALSWSFTTLAVAAKNVMSSIGDYVAIESAFTATQWVLVAAATAALSAVRPRRSSADDAGAPSRAGIAPDLR